MAKSGNYGSIKRLNWVQPKMDDRVEKSFDKDSEPVTRGGHTALRPANAIPEGPRLYLEKAILQPQKYGPGGMQFQRKRDSTGKFATSQAAGKQSTAEEDQTDQQRDAKLRQHRLADQLHGKGNPNKGQSNAKKSMVPGASGTDIAANSVNDSTDQVIGTTMSGQPVYADPYHSAHANFSDQDHQEAAQLHQQMAQDAQMQGDMAGAAQNQSAAQAHSQQVMDGMSPGNRFMDNLFNQEGPPQVQPDDMSQFSDLLGAEQQPMGNPAVAGGGVESMMGQPPADPMAQDPMMSGQQPMDSMNPGQDPMMAETDPLSSFLDQGSAPPPPQAPGMDQNKPLMNEDLGPGPAPGMVDAQTGMPTGEQTDVGDFGGTPEYDLSSIFGDEASVDDPMYDEPGMENDMGDTPEEVESVVEGDMGSEAPPEDDFGGGGDDLMKEDDSGEEELDEATAKALAALARYA